MPKRSPFPRWMRAPCIMRVVARPERAVFSAPPPVAAEAAQASLENRLNSHYPPNLCPSCARADTPLPCACACVYSSPSRRTPADAAARTPRTGYCGRRRRSDRPFRTGLQRWLEEGHVLSQAPVFHEFLESIFSNLRSPYLDGEFDPGSGRTLAARLTHASRAVKAASAVHKAANGRVTRGQPAPLPGIAGGNPG